MKAVVDAKAFSEALNKVSAMLKKSPLPILEEAQIRFTNGECQVTATDLRTWLTARLPAQGDDFTLVLQGTKDVAKASRHFDGELTLELLESRNGKTRRLYMRCGPRAAEFEILNEPDYPAPPEPKAEFAVRTNAAALLARTERVKYAVLGCDYSARQNGFHLRGNQIFAMDGCRLSCDTDDALIFPTPTLLPPDAFEPLKLFGGAEIEITWDERYMTVSDGVLTMIVRKCEGEPMDLRRVLPTSFSDVFHVSPKAFLRELTYLKELAPKKKTPCVRFDAGRLFLANENCKYQTAVELAGESRVVFGFDLRYMMDALKQFRQEEFVTFKVRNALVPMLIEAEGRSDFALLCPVRLKDEALAA